MDKVNIKHPGLVQRGKFIPDDPDLFRKDFTRREGRRVCVSVGIERRDRSDQQNRYYWGCVIKTLSEWSGYEPEEMHEALKAEFLALPDIKTGLRIAHSTAQMDTAQFSEYVEQVRRWAAGHGVVIPDAGAVE